jgi:hypothetical protein
MLTYTTAVYATALTYRMEAHEIACFFATTVNKGTKLAFYFAVRLVLEPTVTISYGNSIPSCDAIRHASAMA